MSFFTHLQILIKIRTDPFFQFPDNWSHPLHKHGFNFWTGNEIEIKPVFGQFPGGHFPDTLFPDRQFPKEFSIGQFSLPAIIPWKDISPKEIYQNGHFPESRISIQE